MPTTMPPRTRKVIEALEMQISGFGGPRTPGEPMRLEYMNATVHGALVHRAVLELGLNIDHALAKSLHAGQRIVIDVYLVES